MCGAAGIQFSQFAYTLVLYSSTLESAGMRKKAKPGKAATKVNAIGSKHHKIKFEDIGE